MAIKKTKKAASETSSPRRDRAKKKASPKKQAADTAPAVESVEACIDVARDNAHRLQVEAELHEARQQLDFVFTHATSPLITWDRQFRITRFSPAFESLTGRRADEVVGKSLEILFPPALVESSMKRIAAMSPGDRNEAIEILHVDGSERNILWNSATMWGPDGKTPISSIAQGQQIAGHTPAAAEEPSTRAKDVTSQGGSLQVVSFKLGNETYGIEITRIQEVILVEGITHVPETSPYLKGLINLRSTIVPVIDLRIRFSLANTELTPESRILVLHAANHTVGIVVDSVNEVLRVTPQQISSPPSTVVCSANEYMTGLVRLKEGLLILLDVDRLFGDDEIKALSRT
ncbi:MAG: chemotaxis protein CheW [Pirellulaceae bacterium]